MRISAFLGCYLTAFGLASAACPGFAADPPSAGYHVIRTVNLDGVGSWDYLRVDPESNRLYIARSTHVMVVDLNAGRLIGEISNTAGVHGVALVPGTRRGVSSNGKANNATIFDTETFKPIATVATGEKPDGILFDPFSKLVLTMNGHANTITLIDPVAASASGTIALPGRPETAVSDEHGKVYVNLEDKAQIAVVDITKRTVLHTWDLAGCEEPTGLAIDLENKRLFSACHSGVLIVINAETGKKVQALPIGKGVDAAAFDPTTKTAFTSNGEGTISVIDEVGPDQFSNRDTVTTLPGAKTMALDPMHHKLFTVALSEGKFVMLEIAK